MSKYKQELESLKKKGFSSTFEYNTFRAKQRGFNSMKEYKDHLAKQKGFEDNGQLHKDWIKKKGFKNNYEYAKKKIEEKGMTGYEYHKSRMKVQGYDTYYQYRKHKLGKTNVDYAKERGFTSHYQYLKFLANRKGFLTIFDYTKSLAEDKGELKSLLIRETIRQNLKTAINKFRKNNIMPDFKSLSDSGIDLNALINKLNNSKLYDPLYEIGHKIPIFYYDFTDKEEIKKCYSHYNLFWQKVDENRSTGKRLIKRLVSQVPKKYHPRSLVTKQ